MINWRIYYADNTTFDDSQGDWIDAPSKGIVCVVVRDPTEIWSRRVVSGYSRPTKCQTCGAGQWPDYYVKAPENEEPFIIARGDLKDFYSRFDSFAIAEQYIKIGRTCSQEQWTKIMDKAVSDPDFPKGTSPRRRSADWKPNARPTTD
jgi:hypothetical protein